MALRSLRLIRIRELDPTMVDPLSVLLLNVATTLFLAGVIWFVQVVHYPLFASVGSTEFSRYEIEHTGRTAWIIAPAMLLEAATSILMIWVRPPTIGIGLAITGLALLVLIWTSTFAMQMPLHAKLFSGFEPALHRSLVVSNWVRTFAWTCRGCLALLMIVRLASRL